MKDSHPVDSMLLDFLAGGGDQLEEIERHLASCSDCRAVVQRLRDAGLTESDAFLDLQDATPSSDWAQVPTELVEAVNRAGTPDLAVNQLWRATPADSTELMLVWVRRVRSDGRPAVVPVSFDQAFADEYDLILNADESPLGVELVFHTTSEGTIDPRSLVDCLSLIDLKSEIEEVRRSRRDGTEVSGHTVGAPISSLHDERVEYRQRLTSRVLAMGTARYEPDSSDEDIDSDALESPGSEDDSLSDLLGDELVSELLRQIRRGLEHTYPRCRILPVSWNLAGGPLRPIATILNVDELVRLVATFNPLDELDVAAASQVVFDGDLSVRAVCFSQSWAPFTSTLIDRQALALAYEIPSGELRPAPDLFIDGLVDDVLLKHFDTVVNPFREVVGVPMDQVLPDPSSAATEAGRTAIAKVASRSSRFTIPGKGPGYERVTRHEQLVISIVERALQQGGVDVEAELREGQ